MTTSFTQQQAAGMHAALARIAATSSDREARSQAAAAVRMAASLDAAGPPEDSEAVSPDEPDAALTERQRDTLDFIRRFRADRGFSPTIRQVGDAIGVRSPNGVKVHLRALIRKGFIRQEPNTARAIVPL